MMEAKGEQCRVFSTPSGRFRDKAIEVPSPKSQNPRKLQLSNFKKEGTDPGPILRLEFELCRLPGTW